MTQRNPLFDAARKPKPPKPSAASNPLFKPPSPPPQPEQPKSKPPGMLESLGNVLDLPGSSVRDVIAGENPFDQWKTPTRSENRTSGKELLDKVGISGSGPISNAVLSIGTEIALDPTSYIGVGILSRGGKALSKAGLLTGTHAADRLADATRTTARAVIDASENPKAAMSAFRMAGGLDKHLDKPIKHTISVFGKDIAKPLAPAIDKAKDIALELPGARQLRAAFSPKVMNTITKAGQDIAQNRKQALDDAIVSVGSRFAEPVRQNSIDGARSILHDVVRDATDSGLEMSRFSHHLDAQDVSQALLNAEHLTRASSMAHAAHELLGTAAKVDKSGVPMLDALKRLGIDTNASRQAISDWAGGRPIESLTIDRALLDDAGRFVRPYTDPEAIGGVRKAIEGFNRLFKTNVTLPFPQFHVRNLAGGQLQNVLMGASDLTQLPHDLTNAYRLRRGKSISGLAEDIPEYRQLGITDEEATTKLRDELFAHNVSGDWQSAIDVSKKKPSAASRMPGNPLEQAAQRGGIAKGLNPLDPDEFLPTKLGGNVASFVEDLNRITPYINLRRQGYTADEAARRVKQLQVDYSDLTEWERKYGRNVIPFYSFASRMLPLVADELIRHPGGPMAQTVKRANSDDQEQLGAMHSDSAKLFGAAVSGNSKELSRQLGGRINPLIRLPLEQATQKDIHSGRPLGSFHAIEKLTGVPVGPVAEHAVRSSPAVRYLTEAAKLRSKYEKLNSLAHVRSSE